MALNAATQWEVRTTGSDSNGGGFRAGASGTDYSQQDAQQATTTTATTVNGTTITVSAGDYTVTNQDVGNHWQINSGTATAGVYEITAVNTGANTWTVDRSAGTAGQTAAGRMGGGFITIGKALGVAVAENVVWVQSGTYTITSGLTMHGGSVTVPNTAPSCLYGYQTTHGDNPTGTNRPLIQTASGVTMLTLGGSSQQAAHLRFDGQDTNSTSGVVCSGSNPDRGTVLFNIYVERCAVRGIYLNSTSNAVGGAAVRCEVNDMKAAATAAIQSNAGFCIDCVVRDNPCHGFYFGGNAAGVFVRCIADSNSGASVDGFNVEDALGHTILLNCVAYNNGRDGVRAANSYTALTVLNSIFVSNGGYGIRLAATRRRVADSTINFNAFYSNTSGTQTGGVAGANDVTLTGDPFTNSAGGDFSLNNTAGAGAACRAVGFPGALDYGGTGYLDLGVLQHQDTGGGGGGGPLLISRVLQ